MWITGSFGAAVRPACGRALWHGPHPLWQVGSLDGAACRSVQDEQRGIRLAVIGHCYATTAQLAQGLEAVAAHEWRQLTWWPGSYIVAASDGATATVLTDVAGTRPIYFTRHGSGWVWATTAKPLAELTGASIDSLALVKRLVFSTVPEITGTATAFGGVYRLPGGCLLRLYRNNGGNYQANWHRYEPEDETTTFAEAATRLRDALTTAIHARVDAAEHITADFSGGLDSTSIALLAARRTNRPLVAITHDDPASVNDDMPFARRAATTEPNIRHVTAPGEADHVFFDRMNQAPITDQPFSDAARWAMRTGLHRLITEHGSDIHFTGSGGDTLLSASPFYLADLVRPGRLSELRRHCLARARLRHLPTASVLAAAARLSRTTYAQALRQAAAAIAHPQRTAKGTRQRLRLHWCAAAELAAWLTPTARQQMAATIFDAADRIPSDLPTSRHRAWAEVREFGTYQAELTAQLHYVGIRAHAPFLDNTVVRACMAIDISERMSPIRQKPLLGAALRGLVPDFILDRTTKGAYDANAFTGIARNAPHLRDLIEDSYLADAGLIDTRLVGAELRRLVAGAPGRLASLESFITAELWIRQHQATPPARTWTQEPVHA